MKVPSGLYTALITQLLKVASVVAIPNLHSTNHTLNDRESRTQINAVIQGGADVSALDPYLTKRDWRIHLNLFAVTVGIGGRWTLQYHALDLIQAPGRPALSTLIQFYKDVLLIGRDDWANEPAQFYREASLGSLKLILQSNQPIA